MVVVQKSGGLSVEGNGIDVIAGAEWNGNKQPTAISRLLTVG